ncbi:MAG TPA: hypothetical protein VFW40_13405 [Capsulimonadaceae bacterium]|nr:hypothetical protein [Capsulimonadaceae bacterium]
MAIATDDANNQYSATQAEVNLQDEIAADDTQFALTDAPQEAQNQEEQTDQSDDYQTSLVEHEGEDEISLATADATQDSDLATAAAAYLLANAQADKDEAVTLAGGTAGNWQQERDDARSNLAKGDADADLNWITSDLTAGDTFESENLLSWQTMDTTDSQEADTLSKEEDSDTQSENDEIAQSEGDEMVALALADQTQGNADAAAGGAFEIAEANQTVTAWTDLVAWASPTTQNPNGMPGQPWIQSQYEQAVALAAWQVTASANEALYAQTLGLDEVQYADSNSEQYVNEVEQIDLAEKDAADTAAGDDEQQASTLEGDEATFEGLATSASDTYELGVAQKVHDYRVTSIQDEQEFLNGVPDDGTDEFYQAMLASVQGDVATLRSQLSTDFDAAAEGQQTDDAGAQKLDTDEIDDKVLATRNQIDQEIDAYDNEESADYDQQQWLDAQALDTLTSTNATGTAAALAALAQQDPSPWNNLAADQSSAVSGQQISLALAQLVLSQTQADLTETLEQAQSDALEANDESQAQTDHDESEEQASSQDESDKAQPISAGENSPDAILPPDDGPAPSLSPDFTAGFEAFFPLSLPPGEGWGEGLGVAGSPLAPGDVRAEGGASGTATFPFIGAGPTAALPSDIGGTNLYLAPTTKDFSGLVMQPLGIGSTLEAISPYLLPTPKLNDTFNSYMEMAGGLLAGMRVDAPPTVMQLVFYMNLNDPFGGGPDTGLSVATFGTILNGGPNDPITDPTDPGPPTWGQGETNPLTNPLSGNSLETNLIRLVQGQGDGIAAQFGELPTGASINPLLDWVNHSRGAVFATAAAELSGRTIAIVQSLTSTLPGLPDLGGQPTIGGPVSSAAAQFSTSSFAGATARAKGGSGTQSAGAQSGGNADGESDPTMEWIDGQLDIFISGILESGVLMRPRVPQTPESDDVQESLARRRKQIEAEVESKRILDWMMHGGTNGDAVAPMGFDPEGGKHVLVFWIDNQAFTWQQGADGRWKIVILEKPEDVTPEEWKNSGPKVWDAAGFREPTATEQAAIDDYLGLAAANARSNWLAEHLPKDVFDELQRTGALAAVVSGNGETLIELEEMLNDPNVTNAQIMKFLAKEGAWNATFGAIFAGFGAVIGPLTKKLVGSTVFKRLLQSGDAVAQRIAAKFDDVAKALNKATSGGPLSSAEEQAIRQHLDDLAKLADADGLEKIVANDLRAAIGEVEGALKSSGSVLDRKMSAKEAAENGLSERDSQWPWRGLHATEDHHPLAQGKSFREWWKEYGFTNDEVEQFKKSLDMDVHRALEESGYWRSELAFQIKQKEIELGVDRLSKDDLLAVIREVLDDIARWSPK